MKFTNIALLTLLSTIVASSPAANPVVRIGSSSNRAKLLEAQASVSGDGEVDFSGLLGQVCANINAGVDGDAAIDDDVLNEFFSKPSLTRRQTAAPKTSTIGTALKNQMLQYHNAWRAHHGAKAVTWSTQLSMAALKSAQKCKFAHTPSNPYGENIAAGTYTNPAYYAYLWYNEVKKYNFNSPGFSSATGHFTQLVWKASAQIGCAWVTGCPGGLPNMLFCEYTPRGNVLPASNFQNNVGREQSSPANPAVPKQNA